MAGQDGGGWAGMAGRGGWAGWLEKTIAFQRSIPPAFPAFPASPALPAFPAPPAFTPIVQRTGTDAGMKQMRSSHAWYFTVPVSVTGVFNDVPSETSSTSLNGFW